MPAAPLRSLRLFLALWPDEATRASIAQWQSAWRWPSAARLVPAERLHLTLHFLGPVPAARRPELSAGLRVRFDPVELEFGTPDLWAGGIAVLRPHAAPEPLVALHARLARALQALDIALEDRPYRPHVTLARKASGAVPPQQPASVRWRAETGYVLVQSLANGGGYEVLEAFSRR